MEDGVDANALNIQYGEAILAQSIWKVDAFARISQRTLVQELRSGAASQRQLRFRVEVANLTNRLNVINFAGIFSGIAIAAPRSATVGLQFEF